MPHKVFNTCTTGEWHFSGAQGVVVSLGLNRESRLLLSVFSPQISVDVLSMNIVINSIYTRYIDTVFKRTALPSIFILVNNIRCIQHQPSSSDTSKLKTTKLAPPNLLSIFVLCCYDTYVIWAHNQE